MESLRNFLDARLAYLAPTRNEQHHSAILLALEKRANSRNRPDCDGPYRLRIALMPALRYTGAGGKAYLRRAMW